MSNRREKEQTTFGLLPSPDPTRPCVETRQGPHTSRSGRFRGRQESDDRTLVLPSPRDVKVDLPKTGSFLPIFTTLIPPLTPFVSLRGTDTRRRPYTVLTPFTPPPSPRIVTKIFSELRQTDGDRTVYIYYTAKPKRGGDGRDTGAKRGFWCRPRGIHGRVRSSYLTPPTHPGTVLLASG